MFTTTAPRSKELVTISPMRRPLSLCRRRTLLIASLAALILVAWGLPQLLIADGTRDLAPQGLLAVRWARGEALSSLWSSPVERLLLTRIAVELAARQEIAEVPGQPATEPAQPSEGEGWTVMLRGYTLFGLSHSRVLLTDGHGYIERYPANLVGAGVAAFGAAALALLLYRRSS